jgi:hypothetical protein
VRREVLQRDDGRSILSGSCENIQIAHYISRARSGLGIPQNLICLTAREHYEYDNGKYHKEIQKAFREHLQAHYENWNEKDLIYDKWQKDKAKELIEMSKPRKNQQIINNFAEKPQKDKEQPPKGFYFLEE